jgi:hypothetical protein
MPRKPPNKKKSNVKKPPPARIPVGQAMQKKGAKKPKPKMPTLGGNIMGLGGTGAQGMIP